MSNSDDSIYIAPGSSWRITSGSMRLDGNLGGFEQWRESRAKARARALHASNCRWKSDKRERLVRAQELKTAFEDLKRRNPSLSDRRAAELAGKPYKVSLSTVLRAAGKK
jgi:hypothetical protein